MKLNISLNRFFLLFAASLLSLQFAFAQESKKDKKEEKIAEIESLVQSKDFVFIAQNAYPATGRNINLTTTYAVRLSSDTVVTDLPYFGRAYVAPMNPSEGGIHFTSTKFSYITKERKKGGWDITILPNDTKDVRQMFLTVSQDGYATLQVLSNNRQNISFNGYITSKSKSR
ncbi:DUF4251 domain-containing protein [Segetibacter aerophilus]|uniref:DUF4251 domain-containing protein n=1 Tax=Segetibacter aerophilus TaxID=670293 RepID=A0A512B6U2_9BACT|nr:DUF4251 domain-containing protein [Segetibacter aerophilus]GEO07672.1 hypothetical protein SAE01_01680 [Segetibacter aerophilus]